MKRKAPCLSTPTPNIDLLKDVYPSHGLSLRPRPLRNQANESQKAVPTSHTLDLPQRNVLSNPPEKSESSLFPIGASAFYAQVPMGSLIEISPGVYGIYTAGGDIPNRRATAGADWEIFVPGQKNILTCSRESIRRCTIVSPILHPQQYAAQTCIFSLTLTITIDKVMNSKELLEIILCPQRWFQGWPELRKTFVPPAMFRQLETIRQSGWVAVPGTGCVIDNQHVQCTLLFISTQNLNPFIVHKGIMEIATLSDNTSLRSWAYEESLSSASFAKAVAAYVGGIVQNSPEQWNDPFSVSKGRSIHNHSWVMSKHSRIVKTIIHILLTGEEQKHGIDDLSLNCLPRATNDMTFLPAQTDKNSIKGGCIDYSNIGIVPIMAQGILSACRSIHEWTFIIADDLYVQQWISAFGTKTMVWLTPENMASFDPTQPLNKFIIMTDIVFNQCCSKFASKNTPPIRIFTHLLSYSADFVRNVHSLSNLAFLWILSCTTSSTRPWSKWLDEEILLRPRFAKAIDKLLRPEITRQQQFLQNLSEYVLISNQVDTEHSLPTMQDNEILHGYQTDLIQRCNLLHYMRRHSRFILSIGPSSFPQNRVQINTVPTTIAIPSIGTVHQNSHANLVPREASGPIEWLSKIQDLILEDGWETVATMITSRIALLPNVQNENKDKIKKIFDESIFDTNLQTVHDWFVLERAKRTATLSFAQSAKELDALRSPVLRQCHQQIGDKIVSVLYIYEFVRRVLTVVTTEHTQRAIRDTANPIPAEDCGICCAKFRAPRTLACRHTFCFNCIEQWRIVSENATCPLCKTAFTTNEYKRLWSNSYNRYDMELQTLTDLPAKYIKTHGLALTTNTELEIFARYQEAYQFFANGIILKNMCDFVMERQLNIAIITNTPLPTRLAGTEWKDCKVTLPNQLTVHNKHTISIYSRHTLPECLTVSYVFILDDSASRLSLYKRLKEICLGDTTIVHAELSYTTISS